MKAAQRVQTETTLHHKLEHLRELLFTGERLADASEYFHDQLVLDDAFMEAGTVADSPGVLAAVEGVLEAMAPGCEAGPVFLIRLAAQRMCHGFLTWGQGVVVFFYFEDADVGFCSYAPHLTDPDIAFTRFSVTPRASGFISRTRGSA